jgi:molybdate-binding protein
MNHTFNPADGLVKSVRGGEADVTVLDESCLGVPTIVLAGCDPATSILSHMLGDMGIRLVWIEQESMPALHSLARGEVHVAGCNFKDPASGTYNLPLVKEIVPFPCTVIRFAVWRHGLIVRAGNPKRISKVSDLVRPDIALINRWPGAGSRGLLNRLLKEAKIPVDLVRGYDKAVNGHLAAAETVASGLVDCGVGIEAAAKANGLDFTPLSEEPYDLVVPNVFLNSPPIQRLLELLRLNKLRRQIDLLRGYDTSSMGLTFS